MSCSMFNHAIIYYSSLDLIYWSYYNMLTVYQSLCWINGTSSSSSSSSPRMHVIYHNWSATKQRPHPQSVAEISRHSVLSGDRIWQCESLICDEVLLWNCSLTIDISLLLYFRPWLSTCDVYSALVTRLWLKNLMAIHASYLMTVRTFDHLWLCWFARSVQLSMAVLNNRHNWYCQFWGTCPPPASGACTYIPIWQFLFTCNSSGQW